MTEFTPGDRVRITSKGVKLARARGEWLVPSPDLVKEVISIYGTGRNHQVYVALRWWPARCWEKV